MSDRLRLVVLLAIAIYFVILFFLLKDKKLSLRYTLFWLFSGLVMLVLALFPQTMDLIGYLTGVEVGSNGLFAILFFCMLMILMSITAIVSKMNDQIKRISQHAGYLEHRVRELEAQIMKEETEE